MPKKENNETKFYLFISLILIIAILIIGSMSFLFDFIIHSNQKLFSLSIIPLFLGLLYESFKFEKSWKLLIFKFIGVFLLSLLVFLPFKNEHYYTLENHTKLWPLFYFGIYVILSVSQYDKKLIQKMTVGTSLILSISLIYWLVEFNFFNEISYLKTILIFIISIFVFMSFLNAFTSISIGNITKLVLSLWGSIILLVFALDNIYKVYNLKSIENANLKEGLIICLQYFLMGISSIYIVKNLNLLLIYLPHKERFYGKDHRTEIKNMNKVHRDRFLDMQISVLNSIHCICYTMVMFYANYKFKFIPSNTAIWIVIITFPFYLFLKDLITRIFTKSYNSTLFKK